MSTVTRIPRRSPSLCTHTLAAPQPIFTRVTERGARVFAETRVFLLAPRARAPPTTAAAAASLTRFSAAAGISAAPRPARSANAHVRVGVRAHVYVMRYVTTAAVPRARCLQDTRASGRRGCGLRHPARVYEDVTTRAR